MSTVSYWQFSTLPSLLAALCLALHTFPLVGGM